MSGTSTPDILYFCIDSSPFQRHLVYFRGPFGSCICQTTEDDDCSFLCQHFSPKDLSQHWANHQAEGYAVDWSCFTKADWNGAPAFVPGIYLAKHTKRSVDFPETTLERARHPNEAANQPSPHLTCVILPITYKTRCVQSARPLPNRILSPFESMKFNSSDARHSLDRSIELPLT